MQDPLRSTIKTLVTDTGTAAGAATLDGASASDANNETGGLRREFIAEGQSDPMGELPVLNAKYITDCEELHLAKKGIRQLAHFDRFINLEVLWLNGNSLKKLEGLDNQIRMFELYVHDNQIETMEGSLKNMKFLKKLMLYNNNLRDLKRQIEVIARLPFLEELDLFGNSVAEEKNYRLYVIYRCPSVKVTARLTRRARSPRSRSLRRPPPPLTSCWRLPPRRSWTGTRSRTSSASRPRWPSRPRATRSRRRRRATCATRRPRPSRTRWPSACSSPGSAAARTTRPGRKPRRTSRSRR